MDVGGNVDVRGHVFIFVILFFTALHEEASSSLLSLFFMFISLLPSYAHNYRCESNFAYARFLRRSLATNEPNAVASKKRS